MNDDIFDKIKQVIGKYLFSGLLILIGSIILIISGGQNGLFKIGGVAILGIGLVSLVFVLDFINKTIALILMVVFLGASAVFAYIDVRSISETIEYREKKAIIYADVIQRLKDIRTAEKAYKNKYGEYTSDYDRLVNFITSDSIPKIKSYGMRPDTIDTDAEAIHLGVMISMPDSLRGLSDEEIKASGLVIRDTSYIPVMTDLFPNDSMALAERVNNLPFILDSLAIVPFSNGKSKFTLATDMIDVSGVKRPVIKVQDSRPFDPTDTLFFGSLQETNTNGSWGSE